MLATLLIWLCVAVVLVRNSNSDVSVVQSAKDWHAKHAACSLDVALNRGILFQRQVRTDFIIVSLIAAEQVTKMLLTEDNDMIQTISPDRTDELLTEPKSADPVCPWLQDAG